MSKNEHAKENEEFFGYPKAWLRVVEEQTRLTLHAHFLIRIYGHVDIKEQFQQAISRDAHDPKLFQETANPMYCVKTGS